MEYKSYVAHLVGTVREYSIKDLGHLLKLFVGESIANDDDHNTLFIAAGMEIDVSELELEEKVITCLRQDRRAVNIFEKWEFEKDYRYSVFFTTAGWEKVEAFIAKTPIHDPVSDFYSENDDVSDECAPVRVVENDLSLVKVWRFYSAYDPAGKEVLIKYPMIIAFHHTHKLIEFRFDSLRGMFADEKNSSAIYKKVVSYLKSVLEKDIGTLIPFDTNFMIEKAQNKVDKAVLYGQYTKTPQGGNAQLEVGHSEDYVLPIIGELKEVMRKHTSELDKVPEVKNALNEILFDNEELADFSWIVVLWESAIKTRQVRVKFTFNYNNSGFDMLQHYYCALVGMERMNDVANYIGKHKELDQEQS